MKKMPTYEEMTKSQPQVEKTVEEVVPTAQTYRITSDVMEFSGLNFMTAKLSTAAKPMPASLLMHHNEGDEHLVFRFTGETAEELYEALNSMTQEHPEVGFAAVMMVDKQIVSPQAGGLRLLLEVVPGTEVKLERWTAKDKDGFEQEREAYSLHKGHVTGALGFRVRKVSFGKKMRIVEHWEGHDE